MSLILFLVCFLHGLGVFVCDDIEMIQCVMNLLNESHFFLFFVMLYLSHPRHAHVRARALSLSSSISLSSSRSLSVSFSHAHTRSLSLSLPCTLSRKLTLRFTLTYCCNILLHHTTYCNTHYCNTLLYHTTASS